MRAIIYILLALHVSGGTVGLLIGSLNMFRAKGDKLHKKAGTVFVLAMCTAAISAIVLSIIHPNQFLFIIGWFTLYLVGTGNRYVFNRLSGMETKPAIIDWALTIGMLVVGIVFIVIGAVRLSSGDFFGIAYLVFGGLGLTLLRKDVSYFRDRIDQKNFWLAAHIQRMVGGYIAALTAFLVVNEKYLPIRLPSLVVWLLPTVALTPLIFKWTAKYASAKSKTPISK